MPRAGLGGRGAGRAELLDERTRGEGLVGASAGEQPQAGGVGGRVHVRVVGSQFGQHRGKGFGDRARGVAEADEHSAIVADDVVDGQAGQAGVFRYSDDHHIVRALDKPPATGAATHPAPVAGAGPHIRE
jgi:hypothetical protein